MNSEFSLEGFLGYVLLQQEGDNLRPVIDHNLQFQSESEPKVIVAESPYPVGLLYWVPGKGFEIKTKMPKTSGIGA